MSLSRMGPTRTLSRMFQLHFFHVLQICTVMQGVVILNVVVLSKLLSNLIIQWHRHQINGLLMALVISLILRLFLCYTIGPLDPTLANFINILFVSFLVKIVLHSVYISTPIEQCVLDTDARKQLF
jgi:hypothetical protein